MVKHCISITSLCFTGICLAALFQGLLGESSHIFSVVKQMNKNDSVNVTMTTTEESIVSMENKRDYIVKLHFILNEANIASYLKDLIYYHYNMYNITTKDLIELSNVKEMNLNQSLNILEKLNISNQFLDVNTFKRLLTISNLSFKDFYEELKTIINPDQTSLKNALQVLGINPVDFSTAAAFGAPGELYDIVKKGVYSVEKLEEATKLLGTDLPTFYENIKKIILGHLEMDKSRMPMIAFLNKTMFDDIWMVLNFNTSDFYRVNSLKEILDNIYTRLNTNLTLGVVTSDHEITIHKRIYAVIENVKDVIVVYAESVSNPAKKYDNIIPIRKLQNNIGTLWSNDSITHIIKKAEQLSEIQTENCTYFTIQNASLIENNVKIVNISDNYLLAEIENGTEFNFGNPLICNDKLYGLASMNDDTKNVFAFDTLHQKPLSSGVSHTKTTFNISLYLISISLLFSLC